QKGGSLAEHPHVQRFRRALGARRQANLGGDDTSQLQDLLADDVVWNGAAGASGAAAKGKEEVTGLWNAFATEGGGGPSIEVGDMAYINDFRREDVHWHAGGQWGEGPQSRDEVIKQFAGFNYATGGTFKLDLNEVYADDTHAASVVELHAGRPDKPDRHMDVK